MSAGEVVLCAAKVTAGVRQPLPLERLIPRDGTKEVGERVLNRTPDRSSLLTLAVEEKLAVADLALALEAEKGGMPKIRFERLAERTGLRLGGVLPDADGATELVAHGIRVGVGFEIAEGNGSRSAPISSIASWLDAAPGWAAGRATKARPPGNWRRRAYHATVCVMGPTGIVIVPRPRQNSTMSSNALLPAPGLPVMTLRAPGFNSTTRCSPAAL
jgi:hypothetical protein